MNQAVQIKSDVVLVTGMSGAGKSVAMHAMEDAGLYCVDNLPAELLLDFLRLERQRAMPRRVAIAVDVRSAGSLPLLLPLLKQLRSEGISVRALFLDANTEALTRRFSETRRPHPLRQEQGADETHDAASEAHRALLDAIALERALLAELRDQSTVLDTSLLRPAQLRAWVRDLVAVDGNHLTLVFESFAFKHGVPSDADFVFDVRVLPNPYYDRNLRPLTGRDKPVADYLQAQPEVAEMQAQIGAFLRRWLPSFAMDQRSYLTVAIGCTGGQHRSVYLVETLAAEFAGHGQVLKRHRELSVIPQPQA
ncbi:MAG TPA: RNase adapter RapZ [Burkholderiaceae bacterium]|jgi:UPF0042 nucleotide-binding protein